MPSQLTQHLLPRFTPSASMARLRASFSSFLRNRTAGGRELRILATRTQAIEDGVLVDVTNTAREAGILYPTALTSAVWEKYVKVPERVEGQDENAQALGSSFHVPHRRQSKRLRNQYASL